MYNKNSYTKAVNFLNSWMCELSGGLYNVPRSQII